jgi:hypothetical protein
VAAADVAAADVAADVAAAPATAEVAAGIGIRMSFGTADAAEAWS